MHIAFLTPEYPHPKVINAAGIGTSMKNLVIALVNEKVEVTVIVYGQQCNDFFIDNGVAIYLIKTIKYKIATWYFYRKHIQNQVNKIIISNKIDLIEAADWTGITAFMKFKVPLIIRFHGSDTYFCNLEKRKQKLKNFWFEKLALKNAKAFIAPTNFSGKLTHKLFKIKNKRTTTITNGLDLDFFNNKNPEIFESGLILYFGTIIRKKGVLELPIIFEKVLQKCPNAKLVLIGSDSEDISTKTKSTWSLIEKQLNENTKDKTQYLKQIPYVEVQNWIKKANICVFPTFAETLGMVTIEAMAMQKAVVSSNKEWVYEIFENEKSGFSIDPKNHNAFAEKIIYLIKNPSACISIGHEARSRVENKFDIKKVVHENIDFYKKIINL